jgi:2-dehydropantoate 2-reductase
LRIAVVGAGAMGSVYAGLLADAGNDVWVVDTWEAHVAAIRRHGLRVEGASGERTVQVGATTSAADVGEVDLVVVATKAMDVRDAVLAARPLLGDTTVVLPIQNGLGSVETAAEVLGSDAHGDDRVIVGVAGGFGASVTAPGSVHHEGMELLRLGERRGPVTSRLEGIAEVWRGAGFTVRTYDDADVLVWEKLVCNVCFSATCALLDVTIGEAMDDPRAWSVASRCAGEAYDVARALGVALPFDDPVEHVRAFGSRIPGARPSLLLDLKAGRRTEIDVINGAIPRAGRTVQVHAPVNATVTALVKALESRATAARG